MVFVISIYDDFSTSDVLTWIRSKGETIIRINNYEDIAYMFKCPAISGVFRHLAVYHFLFTARFRFAYRPTERYRKPQAFFS